MYISGDSMCMKVSSKCKIIGMENRSVISVDWSGGRVNWKRTAQGNLGEDGTVPYGTLLADTQLYLFINT